MKCIRLSCCRVVRFMFEWLDVYVAERNLETVNTCALKNIVNNRCWSISHSMHAEPKSIIDQKVCRPNGKPIWTEIAFKVHDTYRHFQQIYENWYYQRRPEKLCKQFVWRAATNKHTASKHFFFFAGLLVWFVVQIAIYRTVVKGIGIFYNYVFVLVLYHRISRRL